MKLDPFFQRLDGMWGGRRFNAINILYWHRNRWAVWHKLIEGRQKFYWPQLLEQPVVTVTAE